jgi:hypothetical protein
MAHAHNFKDLTGQKFGRWTVIEFARLSKNHHTYWLCKCDCGTVREVQRHDLTSGESASCGCLHNENLGIKSSQAKGDKNPNWKGGRSLGTRGYIFRYVPDHPYAYNGYILEHRAVMEEILGRILDPEEVVHHIDGKKENNEPENLMLFKNASEHLKYHIMLRRLAKKPANETLSFEDQSA